MRIKILNLGYGFLVSLIVFIGIIVAKKKKITLPTKNRHICESKININYLLIWLFYYSRESWYKYIPAEVILL